MKKSGWLFMIIILLLSLPVHQAAAQRVIVFEDDFEGGIHSSWSLEPTWTVVDGESSRVLQGQDHTWAVLDLTLPEAFQLQFQLQILLGRVHLVSHLGDQARYFIGLGEDLPRLNKEYFGVEFQENLSTGTILINDQGWHQITLTSSPGYLRLEIDGQLQWEYIDSEPIPAGAVAFETLENAQVRIDNLQISSLTAPDLQDPDSEAETQQPESASPAQDPISWIRTGGPLGGLGYDVRMHPENPDKMYVTDAFAGVFISEDGGKTWQPSNQGITDRTGESQDAIPVFCLTIDPNQPETIWAGTQYSGGLFKSTDGGKSWTRKTNGITFQDGLTFRGISVHPTDSKTVFAAGELSSWAWAGDPVNGREFDLTQGLLYKSEDGGESWRQVWRGDNLGRYILINPDNPRIMYLSTGIFDREAANSNPQTGEPGGEGVLKSTDGGETWKPANRGLGNLYVGSLFMHPEDPDTLLAGTGNNQYYEEAGIYLTTNGAESWEFVSSEYPYNINSVEFSISDPRIAYAGENSIILRSEDGGYSWIKVSGGDSGWGTPGVRGGFPIDFQVDPRDPDRIFANNYGGGNFLSEDGGKTWEVASSGYTGAQVRGIAVDPEHPGRVYAAARSGLFVSHDGGSTWIGKAAPPYRDMEWYAAAVDPSQPEHILAANNWQGNILSSQDGGSNWQEMSSQPGENQGIRIFKFAPSDPRWIYAGTSAYYSAGVFSPDMPAEGVYLSRDGGRTWMHSTQDDFADAHVMDIDVSTQDHEIVFAATNNYGMLRSRDGGVSWEQVNQGLGRESGVSAVAVDPSSPEIVYAGMIFGGLYQSENLGDSWVQVSTGLNPESYISDIVINPQKTEEIFISDLLSGVYHSQDFGKSWQSLNEGLRMHAVNQLVLTHDSSHLYAATEGEGVYRLDLDGNPPPPAPLPAASDQEQEPNTQQENDTDDPADSETEPEAEEPEADQEEQPPESNLEPPNGQVCPGSYFPLVLSLLLVGSWRITRTSRRDEPK